MMQFLYWQNSEPSGLVLPIIPCQKCAPRYHICQIFSGLCEINYFIAVLTKIISRNCQLQQQMEMEKCEKKNIWKAEWMIQYQTRSVVLIQVRRGPGFTRNQSEGGDLVVLCALPSEYPVFLKGQKYQKGILIYPGEIEEAGVCQGMCVIPVNRYGETFFQLGLHQRPGRNWWCSGN